MNLVLVILEYKPELVDRTCVETPRSRSVDASHVPIVRRESDEVGVSQVLIPGLIIIIPVQFNQLYPDVLLADLSYNLR